MMDSKTTTFKYSSPQQPVFRVIETPLHQYRSSSYAQNNSSTYQDISFSSYLKDKDPTLQNTDCNADDTEISIFDAQKYFSSDINDTKLQQDHQTSSQDVAESIPRFSSVSSVDGYGKFNYRTRSFHATPTASSEASWNSQTGLLTNPPGAIGVSVKGYHHHQDKKKTNSSIARRWIFGRKCCCTGQNSVRVKEATSDSDHDIIGPRQAITTHKNMTMKRDCHQEKEASISSPRTPPSITAEILKIHQHKLMPPNPLILSPENGFITTKDSMPRQQRVSASGGFSFPVLNQTTQSTVSKNVTTPKGINAKKSPLNLMEEDPPRDSIDVFQPSSGKSIIDNPVVTRLPFNNPVSPLDGRAVANTDDDVGSDASSDLFEIESFSTQSISYPMYRRRDSLDEAPTFNARKLALLHQNNIIGQNERNSLDEPPTPSVAATECYAPSEASIAWSVTTAEGFDRASVSNFSISASQVGSADHDSYPRREDQLMGVVWDHSKIKKGNNGSSGLLMMGCRHEKAVSVGPQPVKYNNGHDVIGAGFALHGGGGGGGRPPRATNKPPHTARLSLAFAA